MLKVTTELLFVTHSKEIHLKNILLKKAWSKNTSLQNIYFDISKMTVNIFQIIFPITITPLFYLINSLHSKGLQIDYLLLLFPLFSSLNLMIPILYYRYKIGKIAYQRLEKIKNGLSKILTTLTLIHSTQTKEEILTKSIRNLAMALEYDAALVSVVDRDKKEISRIGQYGFSSEEYNKHFEKKVPVGLIYDILKSKNEFFGAYFIATETEFSRKILRSYFNVNSTDIIKELKISKNWKNGDLFIIPLWSREKELIGYISLDKPKNNLKPTQEDAEIGVIFAEQIVTILESSDKYNAVVEKAQKDNMTGLYNNSFFYEYLPNKLSNKNN